MAAMLRTFLIALALAGAILYGFWRVMEDEKQRLITEQTAIIAEMESRLAKHQAMIERLSRSRRIAHIEIADQVRSSDDMAISSDVLFVEVDEGGRELARQTFTIPGDVLFVDAWTVKFDHERVAEGHPLMGRTLVLLRRIYSDRMNPKDGIAIDTPGAVPPGYAGSESAMYEKKLWESFWALAGDAELSKRMGIRVAQGEAVYKKVRAGEHYELIADTAGGLSMKPRDARASATTPAEG
jgi:hypothetical protein